MTDTTDTQPQSMLAPSLTPAAGAQIALIEIWKRPDVGFPSVFCRAVRPKPRVWVPELNERVMHREQGYATITGIREVTDQPPVFTVQFTEGDVAGQTGEFEAADFRERFIPVKVPRVAFEFGEWETIDHAFAKRALRLGSFHLVEFPGVKWAAKRFDGDRATQRDYDRVIQLRNEAREARHAKV